MEREILQFLKDLVSIPSTSGNEYKVAQRIALEMRKLNYDNVYIDKIGNVTGKIGKGKIKILYDAHSDTVEVGDIKLWKNPPYKPVIKNGYLYGRGTCDDKGTVAAIVYAGALIKSAKLLDNFTLYISCSVQEEVAEGYGISSQFKHLNFRPDYVVIGEPTNLKIGRGHKGRAEIKITVLGKAIHASIPQEGKNAIYTLNQLIEKIQLLNKNYKYTKELGKPVITPTRIETQNASINTLPDKCLIYIDRRTVIGETKQTVTAELLKICNSKTKVEYLKKFFNAWVLPEEHIFVKLAKKVYWDCYHKTPEVILLPFCTNGSFTMGEKRIPTIVFGPGDWKYAHCVNERIKIADVIKAVEFYKTLPKVLSK